MIEIIISVIMFFLGMTQPPVATIVPDNGDSSANTYVTGGVEGLDQYEIEAGRDIGVFQLECDEWGASTYGAYSLSTSGGGYSSYIPLSDCADLTSGSGAQFQIIATSFDMEITCSNCKFNMVYAKISKPGINQQFGRIWVTVTGPNPQLVVTGK